MSASKNANKDQVMLGKFNKELSQISYNRAAGNDYTFFELDNWGDVFVQTNESRDEMWKINEKFINDNFKSGKSFYFSHNPNDINVVVKGSFYDDEINLLKELVFNKYGKEAKFNLINQNWKLEW